jgi:hypothetical protein
VSNEIHPDELDLLPSFSGSSICVGSRFKKLPWWVVVPPDVSSSKRDLIDGLFGLLLFFFNSAAQ